MDGAGYTHYFKQTDSSNPGYPLKFSETPDGTHKGGTLTHKVLLMVTMHSVDIVFSGAPTHRLDYFYIIVLINLGCGRYNTSPDKIWYLSICLKMHGI